MYFKRFLSVATLLATSTAIVAAQPADGGGRHRGGERFTKTLNLTDSQKEQMKALREKHQAATKDLREQARELRRQLREAETAGNAAQIEALSAQHGALMGKLRVASLAARQDFQQVLTPEQREKLQQQRENRRQHRDNRGSRSQQNG